MHQLHRTHPAAQVAGRHTTVRRRTVEQRRQSLQAAGIGCWLINHIQHALVVFEHSAQRTQRVEVKPRAALVASGRGCKIMIGVKATFLGKPASKLRVR